MVQPVFSRSVKQHATCDTLHTRSVMAATVSEDGLRSLEAFPQMRQRVTRLTAGISHGPKLSWRRCIVASALHASSHSTNSAGSDLILLASALEARRLETATADGTLRTCMCTEGGVCYAVACSVRRQ